MQKVLIDTDIAIDYLRGKESAKVLIEPLWKRDAAYLSILSAYELYAGMREQEKESTEDFIQSCHIESITLEIAKEAGKLYKEFRSQGITLNSVDTLINATALINRHKIVTRNISHYPNKDILYTNRG
jgi:predicted nucleic acid-binding protein